MTRHGYKFLRRGAVGPISLVAWPLPDAAGDVAWVEAEGALGQCASGVHVMRVANLSYWLHDELWLVEYDGETVDGSDCVVARRARLTRRIAGWQEGGADRFAEAARDHLVERARETADPRLRADLDIIIGNASYHLPNRSTALAAYCAAMGVGKLYADATEGYRAERRWQSEWIARDLGLD